MITEAQLLPNMVSGQATDNAGTRTLTVTSPLDGFFAALFSRGHST